MKKKTKKTRLVRYGGYVCWYNERLERSFRKYVSVRGPVEWDPTYYGSGVELMRAIDEKARKRWPKASCYEAWRENERSRLY